MPWGLILACPGTPIRSTFWWNVAAWSWKLIINGIELPESGMIFGNGLTPAGGWYEINPGENYQFGRALPVSTYFKKPGEYRVSRRAEGFQSPTV